MMVQQQSLPHTNPGAAPANLEDIAPWHMTAPRTADTGPGGLGAPEGSAELQRYLEPETTTRWNWWEFPGARGWLVLQKGMTAERVAALYALAGRTDSITLAEIAAQFHTRAETLLRWHLQASALMQRFLSHCMEDARMPRRCPTVQVLRERKALSIDALAEIAGVAPATVFRAVHGKPIRPSSKQLIASALQTAPERINWQA
jgi:lambda repressor-like predicted transcriptional regulator